MTERYGMIPDRSPELLSAYMEIEALRKQIAAAEAAINSLQSQLAAANKMLVEAWRERDEASAQLAASELENQRLTQMTEAIFERAKKEVEE